MKKCVYLLLVCLALSGCGARETFETIADEAAEPVLAQPRQITVQLPDDAAAPAMGSGNCRIYLSRDYELVVQTLSAGDLGETVRTLSGYEQEKLTLVKTAQDDLDRYDFVWTSTGEQGQRLGRGVILDDGSYHYCLSVLRDTEKTSQIVWSRVVDSFSVA